MKPRVLIADPDTILNVRVAREVLRWEVILDDQDPPKVVGILLPKGSGMWPLPPFCSNPKAAFKVRDAIAALPEPNRARFKEELRRIIALETGSGALDDGEIILRLTPKHICLAAVTAVSPIH